MAVQINAAHTSPEMPATLLTLLVHTSMFCDQACVIYLFKRIKHQHEAAKNEGTEHGQTCLLQDQLTAVSGRMTTSAYMLTGTIKRMQQRSAIELVLLLKGIQLANASLANTLLSNQCDADAGTDLI